MPAFSQVMNQVYSEGAAIPSFAEALARMLNPYESLSLRVPFYMTSTWRQELGVPGVKMLMNPTTVSFRQAKRITKRDTQQGSIFFHWTNTYGRNNDIMEVDFQGMTGNINLSRGSYRKGGFMDTAAAYINKGSDWINEKLGDASQALDSALTGVQPTGVNKNLAGPSKLVAFWNLYQLTREPVINPRTGAPIYYYIQYSSTIFGNMIMTLVGHFSNVLNFVDDSSNPFNKQYNFGFTVTGTMPSMDYIYTHILQNLSKEFLNNLE